MDVIREFQANYDSGYKASLPQKITQDYDIMECLSSTKECDTLLVRQKATGRKALAKCYTRESIRYDAGGETLLKAIENEAIPHYIGEYKNEGYRCVLREYMEGLSLDEYVRENPLTEDALIRLASGLVGAMKVLHSAKPAIIHRDIKPENIIIREDGGIALIDFGISRVFKKGADSDTVFSGTEDFAPPEQYGFMQTDIRSDIYSFGVVLSWLLTGRAKPILQPRSRLERIAAKCCAFTPEERYQNDDALLRDLGRATGQYRQRMRRRKKAAVCLLLLSAAVLLIAGVVYLQGSRSRAVHFRESRIEKAVRTVLDKPVGSLTAANLELVEMSARGQQQMEDLISVYGEPSFKITYVQ